MLQTSKTLALMLAAALMLPTGCITVDDHGEENLGRTAFKPTRQLVLKSPELEVRHLLFASEKAADDVAMKELRRVGIVPAFVRIENVGPLPVSVSEATLQLRDRYGVLRALRSEELPRNVEHFNGKALTANVANVALIVGVVLILTLAASKGGGGGCCGGNWFGGMGNEDQAEAAPEHRRILNPLQKVTTINYTAPLIAPTTLAPGQFVEGLIFFRADGRLPSWKTLRLELKSAPRSEL